MEKVGRIGEEYALAHSEMLKVHDGETLLATARSIIEHTPDSPVTFIATSVEGTALAAVCAALHGHESDWQRVVLTGRTSATANTPIVVEPVNGGAGWRSALLRRLPEARFADPVPVRELSAAY